MKGIDASSVGGTVFHTAFGWVGIAWSAGGLLAITLPKATEAEAVSDLPRHSEGVHAPPAGLDVPVLIDKVQRYFAGEPVTFDEPLEPTLGTFFQRQVWAIARAIPRGQTRTYGEIARQAGHPRAARAVGQAMAHNPWPPIVPCHRVVGHSGQLTGFGGGLAMKQEMLTMEAATPGDKT